jgi:hypothetical protein
MQCGARTRRKNHISGSEMGVSKGAFVGVSRPSPDAELINDSRGRVDPTVNMRPLHLQTQSSIPSHCEGNIYEDSQRHRRILLGIRYP